MPNRPLLSRRQLECLQGVADHLDSELIAQRLGISPHTVNSHLAAAMATLKAATRREAVIRYVELQRADPEKLTGQFLRLGPMTTDPLADSQPASVCEPVVTFDLAPPAELDDRGSAPAPAHRDGRRHDRPSPILTLALIVGIAAGIVILGAAAEPLLHGAMHLANAVQPYHRN